MKAPQLDQNSRRARRGDPFVQQRRRHASPDVARRLVGLTRAIAPRLLRLALAIALAIGSPLVDSPRPAAAQFATSGAGRFIEGIDWFEWGTTDGDPIPLAGMSKTNTRTVGGSLLATTCTLGPLSNSLFVYRPGDWGGDVLDDMYNVGGTGTSNQMLIGLRTGDGFGYGFDVQFTFSCSATLDGMPVPLTGLVFADAEQMAPNEFIRATIAPEATWRIIDRFRPPDCTASTIATLTSGNELTLAGAPVGCPIGPAVVGFMQGASSANVEIMGGGVTAVALGVMLSADYGDAPSSYGAAGALLSTGFTGGTIPVDTPTSVSDDTFTLASPITAPLHLGATVDPEDSQQFSSNALGDDTTGNGVYGPADDEDGVVPPATITATPAQAYTLPGVTCAGTGVVAGWIDWNNNGTFDAGERSASSSCSGGSVALTWTVPNDVRSATGTFMRLRIGPTATAVSSATGMSPGGEVEDYQVSVVVQPDFGDAPASYGTTLASNGARELPVVGLTLGTQWDGEADGVPGSLANGDDLNAATNDEDGVASANGLMTGSALVANVATTVKVTATNTTATAATLSGWIDLNNNGVFDTGELQRVTVAAASGTATYTLTWPAQASVPSSTFARFRLETGTIASPVPTGLGPGGEVEDYRLIANTPVVKIVKNVSGGNGTFTFNVTGGPTPTSPSITTTGGTGSRTLTNTLVGQTINITENPQAGSNLTGTVCTNARTGGTQVTLPYTLLVQDDITCTFSNTLLADLSILKTSTPNPYVPGQPLTYTMIVTNNGPGSVVGATVNDPLPAALQGAGFTWTCNATAPNACGAASGSGDIATTVNLVAGGTATFSLTGTVPSSTTGSLTNTATITSPASTPDPNLSNNTASTTNPANITADLSITKTSSPNPYVPGLPLTYTVQVRNNGPSDVTGAVVSDPLPAALQGAGFTWTCSASAPNACGASSGSGNIATTVTLVSGGIATFTLTGTVPSGTTGQLSNTTTVSPPSGVNDPTPGNNTATNLNPANPTADLSIAKTSSPNPYVPGLPLTYTILVTNNGPSNVTGAAVSDPLPAALGGASFTWTCTATAPNSCGSASGSGSIATTVNLVSGGTATFTLTGTVPSDITGQLANTATVTPPSGTTDPNLANNTATVQNPANVSADLTITKTSSPNPYVPGLPLTYTVIASNNGPSNVTGALVSDPLPAALTGAGFTWTCSAGAPNACGTTSGSGDIVSTVNLIVGGSATFTLTGIVPSNQTGQFVNSATITPPAGANDPNLTNNTTSNQNPANPTADLSITKASNPNPYVPGLPLTYTLMVTNNGPSAVTGAAVDDPLPVALANFTWTCTVTAPNTCGAASGTGDIHTTVSLGPGASATFSVSGTVPSGTTGQFANTATVTAPPGTTDPNTGNNAASNTSPTNVTADLAITKTSSPNPYVPGQALTYTLEVTNNGPSNVVGATVADPVPGALQGAGFNWTCSTTAPNACGATSGSGDIATTVDLVSGGHATFTLSGIVPSSTTALFINSATVTPPASVNDPNIVNNTASNVNPTNVVADLAIAKSSTPNPYVPGELLTYTVVVTNNGPSDAFGASVTDPLPAALVGAGFTWTCTATTGSMCSDTGVGDIDDSVIVVAGGTLTYTVTGTVPSGTTGQLANTATVIAPFGTTDPNPANDTASNQNPANITADLSITKSSSPNPYVPGQPLTYSVVVTNNGPSDVNGAVVSDPLPAALVGAGFTWTCSATLPNTCGSVSGSGSIATTVNLVSGGTATFTVSGTVPSGTTGQFVNSATVTPPSGTNDPLLSNNTATDQNPANPTADLSITKTSSPNPYVPGQPLTYTIVVTNNGPSDVLGATVTDPLPAALNGVGFTWTCSTPSPSSCGSPSGSGSIATTVNLVSGASATFTLSGTVPSGTTGQFLNSATVTAPAGTTDPNQANNTHQRHQPRQYHRRSLDHQAQQPQPLCAWSTPHLHDRRHQQRSERRHRRKRE